MSLPSVSLHDKFDLTQRRVFLSGTQALVRLCLMQHELDRSNGLNTAGFVTGYRGSPLGGLDQQFPKAAKALEERQLIFEPALNEDLAATALWGTQQAELRGDGAFDGVFGMWYGKGPGVDRSGDVFRHANLAGTSPNGGVLVLMGDDHTCESSTTAHQSEYALVDAMMPILNPVNVSEIIEFGLHGWALSRFAGVWCGLKAVKDTIESTASIDSSLDQFVFNSPDDSELPSDGLNIRTNDPPPVQEARLHQHKLKAVHAYARANPLNDIVWGQDENSRIGIISTGKSYLDTRQALDELGIDESRARSLGLCLYKIGLAWPLEPTELTAFAAGLDRLVVVEEKRPLIEMQVKTLLYGLPNAPQVVGKTNLEGDTLFQSEGALNPIQIAVGIGQHVSSVVEDGQVLARTAELQQVLLAEREALSVVRKPTFCAGCPHNSSTVIPEGSRGYAGIGCHYMVQFLDRNVEGYTHMGGEGANWVGESKFSTRGHVFQNLGDGTYNHSGLMAIRAAIAAGTTMTFKLLYNDAVAMTGGQGHDGGLTVQSLVNEVAGLGVRRLAFVTDDVDRHAGLSLPAGVEITDRSELQSVQRTLAKTPGVTLLVYDQTCAAEKRRRRKRGLHPDPAERIVINEAVCEGCGDCGTQSNCVAIVPSETPWGRKRQIDQSACNKDFSCVRGFCPSFVTVSGGALKKPDKPEIKLPDVPLPTVAPLDAPYALMVTGVGGTGIVTVAALIGMAAHIDGLGCGIIDMAGLAQKGGSVVSHVKLAPSPSDITAIRIAPGTADLLIGGDLIVSASNATLAGLKSGAAKAVVNTHEMMPSDFTHQRDLTLPTDTMQSRLQTAAHAPSVHFVNATHFARQWLGDSIGANLFLLGAAWQKGYLPLTFEAIDQAIVLNNVAVEFNRQAFALGRLWVYDAVKLSPAQAIKVTYPTQPQAETLDGIVLRCKTRLAAYQNARYAKRFEKTLQPLIDAEKTAGKPLSCIAADALCKLMAYKDEYEVARLYTDGDFIKRVSDQFEGNYELKLHLAPPLISKISDSTGRPIKKQYGPWMLKAMRVLAKAKVIRNTPLNPFGYTAERKMEVALVREYEQHIHTAVQAVQADQMNQATQVDDIDTQTQANTLRELLNLPFNVRGFGPVKEQSVAEARQAAQTLLAKLNGTVDTPSKPEGQAA